MKTFPKALKERVYESIKLFNEKYPEFDICIVGSMSMYLQDIDYKYPHDIDIIILNKNLSEDDYIKYKDEIFLMCWKKTGLKIDLRPYTETEYIHINLFNMDIKCCTLKNYIKHTEFIYNQYKSELYMDKLRRLKHLENEKFEKTNI